MQSFGYELMVLSLGLGMAWGFGFWTWSYNLYLEVRFTYNLLSNCSYKPIISRVTVVMGFTIGL